MARDHARIRLDIWTDDDWRDLTSGAQWLYLYLLSSPSLTFAGVADWRPGRIAAANRDWRPADVEWFAHELEDGRFILVDDESEEALIRSFVKHDGLMKSPNMAVAFCKALKAIASPTLRAVAVSELERLKETSPDLSGWKRSDVAKVLAKRSMTFDEGLGTLRETRSETLPLTLPGTLRETLPIEGSNPSGNPSPNPSVTPAPNSLLPTPDSTGVLPRSPKGSGLARVINIANQLEGES